MHLLPERNWHEILKLGLVINDGSNSTIKSSLKRGKKLLTKTITVDFLLKQLLYFFFFFVFQKGSISHKRYVFFPSKEYFSLYYQSPGTPFTIRCSLGNKYEAAHMYNKITFLSITLLSDLKKKNCLKNALKCFKNKTERVVHSGNDYICMPCKLTACVRDV